MPSIHIDPRYCGPATSGNGGVSAGLVAAFVEGPAAQITLRAPPPLGVALLVQVEEGEVQVTHEGSLIATGKPAELELTAPAPVPFEAAARAREGYRNRDDHPLPTCFVCGTSHPTGLNLHPGPVVGREVHAAPWVPDASLDAGDGTVRPEIVWGALDCPSYLGLGAEAPFALLGRLTARIARCPRIGERCVAMGFSTGPREGRKLYGGSALFGEDGELLGVAHAVWIEVDRASVPD